MTSKALEQIGTISIIKGEMFKHYISSKAALALLILSVVACLNLTDDISIAYENSVDRAYSVYMSVLEGENNETKEQYIAEQRQYFDDLDYEYERVISSDTISDDDKQIFEQIYLAVKQTKGAAFEQIVTQKSYSDSVAEGLGVTPYYVNKHEAKLLAENSLREWLYFALMLIVIIYSCSDIFACEYRKGMNSVLKSTKNGRLKTLLAKSLVCLLTFCIGYILIYLPFILNFSASFGNEIFSVPIIFFEGFSGVSSGITFAGMIILESLTHIAFFVMIVMIVMFLSNCLKNYMLTLTVSSAATLLPCLLVLGQENLRLFTLFKSNLWLPAIFVIIMAEITITALCFWRIYNKADNVSRLNRRRLLSKFSGEIQSPH